MRLFIDSADTQEIERCVQTGLVSGITTNPTLIRKSGRDPIEVYKDIQSFGIEDISMEVAGNYTEMLNQADYLIDVFGPVATIKVPMTIDGLKICRRLSASGVCTNVTLIFNAAQALLAAKSGATYISPFVGRIDDQGYAGTEVVRSCVALLARMDTQVLAASIRTTQRVVRCFYNGADVVTMPPAVFWAMYKNVLTDQGLEIFDKDIMEIKAT